MDNLEQMKEELATKKALLADLKAKYENYDNVSQIERYRAGANAVRELDPDRAMKYDKYADDLTQKQLDNDFKQSGIDINRAKLLLQSGTKADIGELQQLWKDNKRFMTQLASKSGTSSDAYKQAEALQDNIESKLQTLNPEIWGNSIKTTDNGGSTVDETKRNEIYDDYVDNTLTPLLIDKKENGIIDTPRTTIVTNINKFIRDNGFSDDDKKSLIKIVDDAISDIKTANETRKNNQSFNADESRKKQNQKLSVGDKIATIGRAMIDINRVKINPTDSAAKKNALLTLLRDESGAAIGADEVVQRMEGFLPENKRSEYKSSTTGYGQALLSMASKDIADSKQMQTIEKYLPLINTQAFLTFIEGGLNPEAVSLWNERNSSKAVKTSTKPTPSNADEFDFSMD